MLPSHPWVQTRCCCCCMWSWPCSFLLRSVAEASLVGITPSYIAGLTETEPKKAAVLHRLREVKIDQSLAAIFTVNTIAHSVGAIGAGSKATAVFGDAWFGLLSGDDVARAVRL